MNLIHPWLSALVCLGIAAFPWIARAGRGVALRLTPAMRELVPVALLVIAVLKAYHPLIHGIAPTAADNGFHLMKLVETLRLLRHGHVFGWTDMEFAGLPHHANYPPGAYLMGSLIYALPGVDLEHAYAWSVLVQELAVVGALYLAGRLHQGRLTGFIAGLLGLCDHGDWWQGGYFSSIEIGMWPQALCTALLVAGLALWPLGAERRRWRWSLLAGLVIGLATLCHPMAGLFAGMAAVPMVFALLSVPGKRLGEVVLSSALVSVTAGVTSAWWLAVYVAKRAFTNPPPFPPISVTELWGHLTDGTFLHAQGMWLGAAAVGLVLFARSRDAFGRFIVLAVPAIALFTSAEPLHLLHPGNPGFADSLQLIRVNFLLRPLTMLAAAHALAWGVERLVRSQRNLVEPWPGLPARLLLGGTLGLAASMPGAAIPEWPTNPIPQAVAGGDRVALETALDRAQQLLQPGDRLATRHHDEKNHELVYATAARQIRMESIGWDAAVMYKYRVRSDDLELLGHIGCTLLLSDGDLPEAMAKLPLVGHFGPFDLRSIPRLPRAWMLGPGQAELVSWDDEEIHVRVSGAKPDSKVALGMAYYDAWSDAAGDPTQAYDFKGATLSAVPAHDGEMIIRYRAPKSQWVGLAITLLGFLALGIGVAFAPRLLGPSWFPEPTPVAPPSPAGGSTLSTPLGPVPARWVSVGIVALALTLIAWRSLTSSNLAEAARWTTSSGFAQDHWATAGLARERGPYDLMFHTAEEESPWATLDLATAHRIHEVVVTNREDCCQDRAVPLIVETSADGQTWDAAAEKDDTFTTWTADFASRSARYVRLRVPRKTLLHLRDVEVY